MKIGSHLKALRTAQNLSQQQLADKTDLRVTVISRWEREDNNPNLEASIKLAAALGVSMDVFCGISNDSLSKLEKMAKKAAMLPKNKVAVLECLIEEFLR